MIMTQFTHTLIMIITSLPMWMTIWVIVLIILHFPCSFFKESETDDDTFEDIKSGSGIGKSLDPSVVFYPDQYCPVVESMPVACFETSLLEMFAVNGEYQSDLEDKLEQLTYEDILEAVNNVNIR